MTALRRALQSCYQCPPHGAVEYTIDASGGKLRARTHLLSLQPIVYLVVYGQVPHILNILSYLAHWKAG